MLYIKSDIFLLQFLFVGLVIVLFIIFLFSGIAGFLKSVNEEKKEKTPLSDIEKWHRKNIGKPSPKGSTKINTVF